MENKVNPRSKEDGHSGSCLRRGDLICLEECVPEMDEWALLGSLPLRTGLPVDDVLLPVGDEEILRQGKERIIL